MKLLTLADGPIEAVVLPEVGARLHRLRAFGHDLLRTPDDPAEHLRDPFFWGAYVMAPWCNRLSTESTPVGRHAVSLETNFSDGSAIHGQVYARPWTNAGNDNALRLQGGGDGWPWLYEVVLEMSIGGSALSLGWSVTNRAEEPMPAGLGIHPWWRRPLMLAVDAGRVYPSNVAPAADPEDVAAERDLRQLGVPADGLDGTWTDLGAHPVELAWTDVGVHASLRPSASATHVAVATPPGLDAIAVEIQTHAPNGLQRLLRGERGAMSMLGPGETLRFDLDIAVWQE